MGHILFLFVLLAAATILPSGLAKSPFTINQPEYAAPSDEFTLSIPPADIKTFLNACGIMCWLAKPNNGPQIASLNILAGNLDHMEVRICGLIILDLYNPVFFTGNLAAGTGSAYGIAAAAVKSWTDEVCNWYSSRYCCYCMG